MKRSTRAILGLLATLLPSIACACLWDTDTIRMERSRFPNTLELITGKFLRHSPEFYEWRIQDRLKRLAADPDNAELLDDLAVAYDKRGQHEKAIETAKRTEQLHPGRYETAANLGTFFFHSGQLEAGLPHIQRALKINPEAHFGREKYQKLLVEYVLQRREEGSDDPPLSKLTVYEESVRGSPSAREVSYTDTFADYLRAVGRSDEALWSEREAATKGLLGMMRFGKHDSPVLLEALGSVLVDISYPNQDAKLLATRAFLMASYQVPAGPSRVAYRGMAARALEQQTPRSSQEQISLESVESTFEKELEDAGRWYATVRDRELKWIREGKNPEAEFVKLYDTEPSVTAFTPPDPMSFDQVHPNKIAIALAVVLAVVVTLIASGVWLLRWWLRKVAAAGQATPSR